MEDKTAVEAVLFAATGPLTVQQIREATGLETGMVEFALRDLKREYEDRDSAIVIARTGNEFRMVLRQDCAKFTGIVAGPELSGGTMRTLAAIAYNQPVKQSRIVQARGPRAYEDIQTLVAKGFVSAKPSGQTYELTTTKRFAEHFGIGSDRKSDIRKWMDRMMGESQQRPLPFSIYYT